MFMTVWMFWSALKISSCSKQHDVSTNYVDWFEKSHENNWKTIAVVGISIIDKWSSNLGYCCVWCGIVRTFGWF